MYPSIFTLTNVLVSIGEISEVTQTHIQVIIHLTAILFFQILLYLPFAGYICCLFLVESYVFHKMVCINVLLYGCVVFAYMYSTFGI